MALVIIRHAGESVRIGDATVKVEHISRGPNPQVKLVIDAPRSVLILRRELERYDNTKGEATREQP